MIVTGGGSNFLHCLRGHQGRFERWLYLQLCPDRCGGMPGTRHCRELPDDHLKYTHSDEVSTRVNQVSNLPIELANPSQFSSRIYCLLFHDQYCTHRVIPMIMIICCSPQVDSQYQSPPSRSHPFGIPAPHDLGDIANQIQPEDSRSAHPQSSLRQV